MTSSWLIMAVAFCATVLLVVALYPALMVHFMGDSIKNATARELMGIEQRRRKAIYSVLFGAVVMIVLVLSELDLALAVSIAVVSAIVFSFLVSLFYRQRQKNREAVFESRMLDFLVLVCNSLRSGFALSTSIETSAKSLGGPIEQEFNQMLAEYRLGMELSEAIRRMNSRIRSENLQLFTATVSISIQTGGSISHVLERLIETIRKRNDVMDKLKALVAQFKFEAVVMSFFPLIAFVLLYYVDPRLMSPMLTTGIGWGAIVVVVGLEVVGLLILKRISNIKI